MTDISDLSDSIKRGVMELAEENTSLRTENASLRSRAEAAEGQLCRAREALELHPGGDPSALDVLGHRIVAVEKALSTPSPCAHADKVKGLKAAVEWALSPEAYYLFGEHDQAIAFSNELRRRTGGEG